MDGRLGSWLVGIDAKNENPLLRIRHRDGFGSQLGDFVVERMLVVADRVRALKNAGPAGVRGIGSRGGDTTGATGWRHRPNSPETTHRQAGLERRRAATTGGQTVLFS